MIKYKTGGWKTLIEQVEVLRETKKCVFLNSYRGESRVNKNSSYENYFDTWQEAYDYIHRQAINALSMKKTALTKAEEKLKEIENLKKCR